MATNKTREAAHLWQARLNRYFASGLSVKEFVERESLSFQAFYRWKKILATGTKVPERSERSNGKAKTVTGDFIELFSRRPEDQAVAAAKASAEIVTSNGTRIIVPLSVIEQHLARLFTAFPGGAR